MYAAAGASLRHNYQGDASAVPMPQPPLPAADAAPEILKGRIFSLIHPVVMGGLFAGSVYAGWLGFQWRRTR